MPCLQVTASQTEYNKGCQGMLIISLDGAMAAGLFDEKMHWFGECVRAHSWDWKGCRVSLSLIFRSSRQVLDASVPGTITWPFPGVWLESFITICFLGHRLVAWAAFYYDDKMMLMVILETLTIIGCLICVILGALHKLSYLIFMTFSKGWCCCWPHYILREVIT